MTTFLLQATLLSKTQERYNIATQHNPIIFQPFYR